MKNFIEVTNANGKHLVNINSIGFVEECKDGCLVSFSALKKDDRYALLIVKESYQTVCSLIEEAQK